MGNLTRKLFFLVALPRSGNTLFASIINQNPNVVCTANSVTLEIIKDLHLLKQSKFNQRISEIKQVLGSKQGKIELEEELLIELSELIKKIK